MGLQRVGRLGVGPAPEEFAFGAKPVFLGRAVRMAASLPAGISEAGDFLMGRRQDRHGCRARKSISTEAADLGSGGVGHGIATSIVITEVVSESANSPLMPYGWYNPANRQSARPIRLHLPERGMGIDS